MNLTKKERYNLSKQESVTYLNKRKLLLEEIRKEYKKISRGNPEEKVVFPAPNPSRIVPDAIAASE